MLHEYNEIKDVAQMVIGKLGMSLLDMFLNHYDSDVSTAVVCLFYF